MTDKSPIAAIWRTLLACALATAAGGCAFKADPPPAAVGGPKLYGSLKDPVDRVPPRRIAEPPRTRVAVAKGHSAEPVQAVAAPASGKSRSQSGIVADADRPAPERRPAAPQQTAVVSPPPPAVAPVAVAPASPTLAAPEPREALPLASARRSPVAPVASQDQPVAPPRAAPVVAPSAPALSDAEVAAVIGRAEFQLRIGNVKAAREALEPAVKAGNVDAAVALAATYDPLELAKLLVPPGSHDVQSAVKYYSEAGARGSKLARARLERLLGATADEPSEAARPDSGRQ